jgi:hypothetical protein
MRKGLTLTLMTVVAIAMMGSAAAMAPVIGDIPDIIVGDESSVTNPNLFVYPDAIDLDEWVTDADDPIANIRWSYEVVGTQLYQINGVAPLTTSDDPVNPGAKAIDQSDTDGAKVDANARTITVRDIALSPIAGPNASDPITNHSQTVTIWASDGEDADSHTIIIWTENDQPDRLSGVVQPSGTKIYEKNFTGGPAPDWTWQFTVGTVTSSTPSGRTGVCIGVPLGGVNIGQWNQTANFIDLTPNAVFELRATMNSTQSTLESVPLFDFVYDNFTNPATSPNAYGGDYLFLGNEGGANAPGSGGRTNYRMFFTPMPILTPQFNNATTGAFTATNAPLNDMRVYFRIIDADGAGYNAEADQGVICMENVEIWKYDMGDETAVGAAEYDVQNITAATHYGLAPGGGTTFTFAGGDVTIAPTNAAGWNDEGIMIVQPGDNVLNVATGVGVLDDFPVAWDSDELFKVSIVLSGSNAAADTNPPDAVRMGADGPTTELLCANNVTPNFSTIGTPKQDATVGGPQTYVCYFYTHNETRSGLPNSHQIRPRFDLINVAALGANGFTRNAGGVIMRSMTMQQVSFPGMN